MQILVFNFTYMKLSIKDYLMIIVMIIIIIISLLIIENTKHNNEESIIKTKFCLDKLKDSTDGNLYNSFNNCNFSVKNN